MSLSLILSMSATLAAPQQPAAPAPLIVHEWGTFTSMQGSDGLVLEGLHHEEEGLPAFVHNLRGIEAAPGGAKGRTAVKFPASRVTQKMETPVIYFHTEVPRSVRVLVQFNQGLLTQFYPIPDIVGPPLDGLQKRVDGPEVDLTGIKRSLLMWNVDLIPYGAEAPSEIPAVDPDDPWAFARQVRAAYVRTKEVEGIARAAEAEHYLFYRGLGRFQLPVKVSAREGNHGTLANGGSHPLPFAVAMEITDEGGRFQLLGEVPAGGEREIALGDLPMRRDLKKVVGGLAAHVMAALVEQGLYHDEARAMVATWSRQWFTSRGHRVVYLVPSEEVRRVLPMSIDPKPDQLVRVLVGRLEYITPEIEALVERALLERIADQGAFRAQAEQYLVGLGRFLEPHLRRALASTQREEVRTSALEVLQSR